MKELKLLNIVCKYNNIIVLTEHKINTFLLGTKSLRVPNGESNIICAMLETVKRMPSWKRLIPKLLK